MRSPKRRRPRVRIIAPPSGVNLESVAGRATYVGSPEHKDAPSFAGEPRPRADASICDRALIGKQAELTNWLREGNRNGRVSELFEGDFPRYVWHKEGDGVYEARLVNSAAGHYKGYPLNADEWPTGL
jgi:hypothetical protein